jgi:RNA-directed DNA polymerase
LAEQKIKFISIVLRVITLKIITYNVNGLRAAFEKKEFIEYISNSNADIIAVQETKMNEPYAKTELTGYIAEWNFADRSGYSGTLCLFKHKPNSIMHGFGSEKPDTEGRVITLEYPAFYFVNAYVPNSQSDLSRLYYRLEWDNHFLDYLLNLNEQKPVIIGGDFNVARDHIDIFPENLRNIENPPGFLSGERDNFNTLLNVGFIDVFRKLNPSLEKAYTWWSNRLHKRKENRGWRIDYFLVSENIFPNVKNCVIRSDVYCGDHAPVELIIDLPVGKNFSEIKKSSIPPIGKIKDFSRLDSLLNDDILSSMWQRIDWKAAEDTLLKYQREIALAALRKDRHAIINSQKNLALSVEAKILAVRHVSNSATQAGIDKIKWITDAEKMRAVFSLDSKDYSAKPMRLLKVTPKGQTKERHIQIPTMFDRAVQTLYAYSLDPVSESTACRKSFAFRKGRSQYDIHAFIMDALKGNDPPRYIIKADIKACYASISHEWLLENIPMNKYILKEFLKAGHVFGGEIFPPDDFGISLGSSLSPILGNMALDGAQQVIFEGLYGKSYGGIDYADGNLIRFADDILITARTMESAEKIMDILRAFIAVRGFTFSEQKTKIINLADGFDFLSRNYKYVNGLIHAAPSEAAVQKMEQSMRDFILPYRGGQKNLIERLNRKLVGWANYHRITEAKPAFRRIDNTVKSLLLQLCEKLHPLLPRKKVISKYFYKEANGEYVYTLENKPDVRIMRIAETILVNHKPVGTKKNPYLDGEYYDKRTGRREIAAVTGKYKAIWVRQRGKCYYCGRLILTDEEKVLVMIDPTRPETPKNQAYIHQYCSLGEAEFYNSDMDIDSDFDLYDFLEKLSGPTSRQGGKKYKFSQLTEYFRLKDDSVFTLTFIEIEKIMGTLLCESAKKYLDYWYRKGDLKISHAWLSNGYKIRKLDFEKKRVIYERSEDFGKAIKIPDIILNGRVPVNVKQEVENFFDYIKKKYGL